MPIEYRTTDNNEHFLQYMQSLGKENWIYCGEKGDKLVFYREVPKERKARTIISSDDFTPFWNLYPKERRKKKKEAQDFWNKLDEKRRTLALEGLKKYLVYWKKTNQDLNFISYPLYWLKGERYMDEGLDDAPKNPVNEKLRTDLEEERKLEQDRLWMESQLAKLKASGKWDEWYNQAREETPENQRQYEMLILTRIKKRLRNNPL